jgi:hypothetical protein
MTITISFRQKRHRVSTMDGLVAECDKSDPYFPVLHEAVSGREVGSLTGKAIWLAAFKKMEYLKPLAEYLTYLAATEHKPASDVSLAHELTFDMGLPNCVANTLMFYSCPRPRMA